MRCTPLNSRRIILGLIRSLVLAANFWLATTKGWAGDDAVSPEYQVKAAFLLNFGKFVTWQENDFASPRAPLVIGVLGDNPFQDDLEKMIVGKSIQGHPLQFQIFPNAEAARHCQILFIRSAAQNDTSTILSALHGAHVLTVTENQKDFRASGYAVNFVLLDNHIRFEINQVAAEQAGLTISSKLLALGLKPNS